MLTRRAKRDNLPCAKPIHEETTEGRSVTLKDIAKLPKLLAQFLIRFAVLFPRPAGRALLHGYVRPTSSGIMRKPSL